MKVKRMLKLISFVMLIIAVVFVICALSCPTLGSTIYIGDFAFGVEHWRVCYLIYFIIMVSLFFLSLCIKE